MGKLVVPIIPDEARTFGMDAMFREVGIYATGGQKYTPVDAHMLMNYHEARDGQLLEEGITEVGAAASFATAGTAHSTHGVPMVPFYLFYSMFGLQRTGDQFWALGDARGRGFLIGGTAGRTTLNGEGLQHEDGNSHLTAMVYPTLQAYDPAYAYEMAVIVRDGMRRMFHEGEDVFYYITAYNENYAMPPMPKGVEDGILKGLYLAAPAREGKHRVQLFGSGTILRCALAAQEILASRYGVAADVWSATSYQQLYREARAVERENRMHPAAKPRVPYVSRVLEGHPGPVVAATDYVSEVPSVIARFVPRRFLPLGTNGYGRSDTREALRRFFEVDAQCIALTALYGLAQDGAIDAKVAEKAVRELDVDPDKVDPAIG